MRRLPLLDFHVDAILLRVRGRSGQRKLSNSAPSVDARAKADDPCSRKADQSLLLTERYAPT